ncbi:MAG: hypothetical protein JSV62_09140 [Promethearchaeota archaeon]|nr:MAG: hypothetical protein JSV62_09140 [Candidatus Lokiarchaeota archaeon]
MSSIIFLIFMRYISFCSYIYNVDLLVISFWRHVIRVYKFNKKRKDISEKIYDRIDDKKTARGKLTTLLSAGINPPDWVAHKILNLLVDKGIANDHPAVKWTQLYLKTKGMEYINFESSYKILSQLSSDAPTSSKSILSPGQKDMVKRIIWDLTGGRSWETGEFIPYDQAVPHHILHDPTTGKTLYGPKWENKFEYFALLSKKRNLEIENVYDRRKTQALFTYMWEQFKVGNFKAATAHWNQYDSKRQSDFLKERSSKRYLDYWLNIIKNGV